MSDQSPSWGTTAPTVPPHQPSEELRAALGAVRTEVAKAVVGQDAAVSGLVIALLCRGHVLLEGVPGVAKTLLVRALSAALDLETKRVQFTPDLMPGDVTGSLVYDARTAEFSFRAGPGVHQPPAGRRDQPDAAEDAGVAARGDGGASGVDRRHPAPAARPVPRHRDAEPRRVRGHLHAPRGAAGPVPAQAGAAHARAARGDRGAHPARRRLRPARPRRRRAAAGGDAGDARARPGGGRPRADRPRGPRVRRRRVPRHPAVARRSPSGSPPVAPRLCWRRPAPGPGCPAGAT